MQAHHFTLLHQSQGLLDSNYITQAEQNLNSFSSKRITDLLSHRKIPQKNGWSDLEIKNFLHQITLMDANNGLGNVGLGEREGRIYSNIVKERWFGGMSHGVGRSGDIMAQQPKAAGSSLVANLTKYLALDAVRMSGWKYCKEVMVVPLCTGMSLTMTFLALRNALPPTLRNQKTKVLWSRIDQKSCLKSILTAGLEPDIVELEQKGDGLVTDVAEMEKKMKENIEKNDILCVFLTTSTFAPREPDDIIPISKLCKQYNIPLVVNNAYGLCCTKTMNAIELASRQGRVDVVISSLDKNFMVPVGGALICQSQGAGNYDYSQSGNVTENGPLGPSQPQQQNPSLLSQIAQSYPGRASGAPMLDLFITLLSMGQEGLQNIWKSRKSILAEYMKDLQKCLDEINETLGLESDSSKLRILQTPNNKISVCIDLTGLVGYYNKTSPDATRIGISSECKKFLNSIGANLFNHRVSGPRVVPSPNASEKSIGGIKFKNYGAHGDNYTYPYLATAVAVGVEKEELDVFLDRLKKTILGDVCGISVTNSSSKGGGPTGPNGGNSGGGGKVKGNTKQNSDTAAAFGTKPANVAGNKV